MIKSLRQSFGISLVFVGITISMFLNYYFPFLYWTRYVMFLSCILICDKTTFRKHVQWNNTFKVLFAFQILMLIYLFLFYNDEYYYNWNKYLSFHLYVIALIFILARTDKLWERDFVPVLWGISTVLSFLVAFCTFTGLIELDLMVNKEDAILEYFTCNISVLANFVSSLILLRKLDNKVILKILLLGLVLLDFYILANSGKRSYFLSALVMLILFLYKIKRLTAGLIIGSAIFVLGNIFFPQLREITSEILTRTYEGINTLFLDRRNVTHIDWNNSADQRLYLKKLAMIKFANFSWYNYIFGGGYLLQFFDNPLVESYLDMGILGIILFSYIIVFVPIKAYLQCSEGDSNLLLCIMIASMNIVIIITNNDPYTHSMYTPICMIAMCLYSYRIQK